MRKTECSVIEGKKGVFEEGGKQASKERIWQWFLINYFE